jgi:polysaccharide biosynthesis protein PslH
VKILFLTPQLPYPPHKGTTLRNFGLIRALGERHEVSVLSLGDPGDTGNIATLSQNCRVLGVYQAENRASIRRAIDLVASRKPDLVQRLRSDAFTSRLRRVVETERFDVVQIEGLEMTGLWIKALGAGTYLDGSIAVLDDHNAEYRLQETAAAIDLRARRWIGGGYSWLQAKRLRHYERLVSERVDGIITVSPEDQEALRELGVRSPIQVIQNCLDVTRLPFLASPSEREAAEIVFTGTMDYRPNVDAATWFCAEVWPRVLSLVPEARFTIVGRDPSLAVRQLAQQHGVEVTGAVPDVGPFLRRATVYVVPMRMGGGVRFKVLEALAAGLPVVSTTMGATGVDLTPGVHALLADQPDEMALTIVRLFQRPEERLAMAKAGRELVADRFDWAVVIPVLEAFYAQLLEPPKIESNFEHPDESRAAGT